MTSLIRRFRLSAVLACAAVTFATAAASDAWAQGTGTGLLGEYYDTQDFTGPRITRVDATVDFNFVTAGVLPVGITDSNNISVRWRGRVQALAAGNYVFSTGSDDGSRIYLDGVLILGTNWRDQGTTIRSSAPIALALNSFHDITVEFYQGGGGAECHLYWSGPPSATNVIIPMLQLYPGSGTPLAAPTVTPNGATLLAPQLVTLSGPGGSTLYYSLDGTDPCPAGPSPTALNYTTTGAFTVSTYTQVRVRAYQAGEVASDLVTAFFSPQFNPTSATVGSTVPQVYFEYSRTAANLIALPNIAGLLVEQRGLVQQPTMNQGAAPAGVPNRPQGTNFAYSYTGYVNIPADDTYTFFTQSNAASKLFIGNNTVVFNDGDRSFNIETSGQIYLKTGLHALTVTAWYRDQGTANLVVSWQSSTIPKAQIPAGSLRTDPVAVTPTISPAPGTFNPSQVVTINCATPGATLFYTTDGTVPDPRQATGTGVDGMTLTLSATTTVQVIAVAPGFSPSAVASSTFTRTGVGPIPLSATSAGVNTEVIVTFDRPLLESTVAPGNFTLSSGAVSAAVPMARPGALVARWTMDGGAGTDTIGGNNGTVVNPGGAPPAPSIANFVNPTAANGGTLQFNGTTTTFTVPSAAALNVGYGSFTIAGWLQTAARATNQSVISKWDATANGANGLGWKLDLTPTGQLQFQMRDNATNPINGRAFNASANGIISADNTWFHIAVRWDKLTNRVSWFRNGTLIQTTDGDANMENLNTTTALNIGSATNGFFNGAMDDVRLYKVALSNNEILALSTGADKISAGVKLTTTALAPATQFTLTVLPGIQETGGSAVAAGTTIPFRFLPTGTVTYERWGNYSEVTASGTPSIVGGAISDLARNAIFPNDPSFGSQPTSAEVQQTNPNMGNFGARLRGYFIAPSTNSFQFAIATDDGGKLFVSSDEDPANKVLVAYTNNWNPLRKFVNTANPTNLPVQSAPIPMIANKKYYFEAYDKEGGGGDNISVGVNINATVPDDALPMGFVGHPVAPAANIAPYVDPAVFLLQPVSKTVAAGGTFTLTVVVQATYTSAPRLQWQFNGVDILNANAASYTVVGATPANAGNYTCVVTNSVSTVTSATAVVTVVNGPSVTVAPTGGPIAGGQSVTITGTGFLHGPVTVTFGGTAATNTVVASNTSLTATTPAHAAGNVITLVSTQEDTQVSSAYTYYGVPNATAPVNPAVGSFAGGTVVTITGTSLGSTGATTVTFGGVAATGVTVAANGNSLTCTTGAHAGGLANIVVTTPGGVSTLTNAFTYYDAPAVGLPLVPNVGPLTGLVGVVINGTNLGATGITTVSFGGTAATNVVVNGAGTQITCDAPAHAAGAVTVSVTTPGGTANQATAFTYYAVPAFTLPLNPTAGPIAGLAGVQISGTNLGTTGLTTVTFGGTPATGVTVNGAGTLITCNAPANAAGLVTVAVTTPGGSANQANAFTYYGTPTIAPPLNPATGPLGGVVGVQIPGTSLGATGLTTVTFGGTPALNVVVNAGGTLITCDAPAHAAGPVTVSVTAPGGVANQLNAFTYYDVPAFSLPVNPVTGPSQGGTVVTISGTNLGATGLTTVSFGGSPATNVTVNGAATVITATTSGHDAGLVGVTVTTPGGVLTQAGAYTYVGPRIISVVPPTGPVAGGQPVVITGSGFLTGTVTFGGAAPTTFTVVNPTTINATPAAHAVGAVDVAVTVGPDTATLVGGYTYQSAATVTSVVLNRGPIGGGQLVTINGTSFAPGQTTVTFGGTPATAITVQAGNNTLTCLTPAHAAGVVTVGVSTFGGAPVTLVNAYTYVPPPTLATVVPSRGTTLGGQTVTLTGTNFETGNTTVSLGASGPISATVTSPTTLTIVTPPQGAGAVNVTVTTFALQSSAPMVSGYTFVNPGTTVNLALGMTADTLTPGLNTNVVYTLTLSNTGGVAATGVSVVDSLPAGLTYVNSVPSVGSYVPGTGLWSVGSLATLATATLQITATVTSTTPIVNTAEVASCVEPDVNSTPFNNVVGEDDQASVTVSAGLTFQTAAGLLAPSTSGVPYYQQLSASGGVPGYQWSLTSAAATFPFDLDPATGVISGTGPTATGTYTFTLAVTDSSAPPATASRSFTIVVSAPAGGGPILTTTPAPPAAMVGVAYYHQFTASGGAGPYTWSVLGGTPSLPAGLFLNSVTGVLAGTPTAVGGPINFTIQATNGTLASNPFSITVSANPVVILTASLPDGSVGAPYDQTVQSSGGIGPFAWSVSTGILPSGLTLTAGTGRVATITGTPGSNTPQTFTLRCSDTSAGGVAGTKLYTLNVQSGAAVFAPTSTPVPPQGTINRPFALNLTAIGGTRPYTWSISGVALPAGVTLNGAAGIISGTPTVEGVFQITLRGQDSAGAVAFQTVSINIAPAPVITSVSPLPNAISGVAYFQQLSMTGGAAPFTWAVASGLPPTGVTLSTASGALSGTAGAAAVANFNVTVTDANGAVSPSVPFQVTIVNAGGTLTLLSGLPPATIGVPYSATVQFTGGAAPFTFAAVGTPPAGLTFDAATGTISGTPTSAVSTFQIRVTDVAGLPGVLTNVLAVNSPLAISTLGLPNGTVGAAYAASLISTGGVGAVQWTLVSGTLPSGVVLNTSTGLISGVAGINAVSTFKVQATDSAGTFVQRQYTVTVGGGGPPPPPPPSGGGGGGGGGCGLLGAELLLVWLLKKRADRRKA